MLLTCASLQSPQFGEKAQQQAEQAQQQAEQAQQQAEQAQQQAQQAQQQAEQAQQAVVKVQQDVQAEQAKPAGQATAPPLSDQKPNKDSSSGFFSARVSLALCTEQQLQRVRVLHSHGHQLLPLSPALPAIVISSMSCYASVMSAHDAPCCSRNCCCLSAYVEARPTAMAAQSSRQRTASNYLWQMNDTACQPYCLNHCIC